MAAPPIGIDLGTSNSCVAIARGADVELSPCAARAAAVAALRAVRAAPRRLIERAAAGVEEEDHVVPTNTKGEAAGRVHPAQEEVRSVCERSWAPRSAEGEPVAAVEAVIVRQHEAKQRRRTGRVRIE